jgi:hypothetical protein
MKSFTLTRPSVPLTAACAPSALWPVTAAAPVAAPILAAMRAPISQVDQVQAQAELALTNGRISGINGSTGFMGLDSSVDGKRYADERGIPPRGWPV